MLEKNHERIASVMMPCRISVYEKEDGKIYISMINGHALAAAMPPSTIDIMSQAALEIDEIVAEVILQSNWDMKQRELANPANLFQFRAV